MEEFFREFFQSEAYRNSAKARVLAGGAPHLENFWHAKINGKPVERHEHSGPDGGPIPYTWQD